LLSRISFDIIVVDGRERVECIRHSLPALKEPGVILLDDAERPEYAAGIQFLKDRSFRRLDFWGIAPGMLDEKSTAVLYRPNNCLNI